MGLSRRPACQAENDLAAGAGLVLGTFYQAAAVFLKRDAGVPGATLRVGIESMQEDLHLHANLLVARQLIVLRQDRMHFGFHCTPPLPTIPERCEPQIPGYPPISARSLKTQAAEISFARGGTVHHIRYNGHGEWHIRGKVLPVDSRCRERRSCPTGRDRRGNYFGGKPISQEMGRDQFSHFLQGCPRIEKHQY